MEMTFYKKVFHFVIYVLGTILAPKLIYFLLNKIKMKNCGLLG